MGDFSMPLVPVIEAGSKILDSLPDPVFKNIMGILSQQHARLDAVELMRLLREATGVDADGALVLLQTMLHLVDNERSFDPPEAIISARHKAAPENEAARVRLRERISAVRNCSALLVFSKAAKLLLRNERNFTSARTMTELRPVFGDDVSAPPLAYVIQHILEIKYSTEAGKYETMYIASDDRDIDDLIAILNHSKEKSMSLRSNLEHHRMSYFTTNRIVNS